MSEPVLSDFILQATFAVQGMVIAFSNGLLFLTIILKKSLRIRKEMLIISGMAAVDIIYGLGTMLIGLHRFFVMVYGVSNDPTTPWSCVILPQIFFLYVGVQLTVVMNLIVSIDRFIAVAYPMNYRRRTVSDYKKVLVIVALLGIVFFFHLIGCVYFFPRPSGTTRSCSATVFSVNYNLYLYTFISVGGALSVFVYAGVFLAYRKSMRKVVQYQQNDLQKIRMERRLTVTLGIISLSTLFLFTIPYSIYAVTNWMGKPTTWNTVLTILARISAFINVVIYVQRQKEIRQGMWNLIRCEKARRVEIIITITQERDSSREISHRLM